MEDPPKRHISQSQNDLRFDDGLFPFHSPLLRESQLFSFPPLINMLKFGGSPCLLSGRKLVYSRDRQPSKWCCLPVQSPDRRSVASRSGREDPRSWDRGVAPIARPPVDWPAARRTRCKIRGRAGTRQQTVARLPTIRAGAQCRVGGRAVAERNNSTILPGEVQ